MAVAMMTAPTLAIVRRVMTASGQTQNQKNRDNQFRNHF